MNHLILILSLCLILTSSLPLKKYLFDDDTVQQYGSRCLDGSPGGYFYRKSNANKGDIGYDSWVFFLEGGGVCAEPIDCEVRKYNHLGSSNFWDETKEFTTSVLSDDSKVNKFAGWNHVFVPYCTGDTHTGTLTTSDDLGMYFAGHNNLEAIVQNLRDKAGLSNATHVLLSGGSAGGIGVFNNADWFKGQFPNAVLKAAPLAGYFFPKDIILYETWILGLDVPYPEIASEYLANWYHSYLDESCLKANPDLSGRCWDASFVYPYIETEMLIVENIYDGSLLQFLGWLNYGTLASEYLAYFGDTMVSSIQVESTNVTKPKDGYFMPSCLDHTGNLCVASPTAISGYTYSDILNDWYFEINKLPHRLVDDCWSKGSQPCNKVCPRLCG
jgi:ribosome maturation protein SDO1